MVWREQLAHPAGIRAPVLFIVQGLTQYVGASYAVMLFALMPSTTVAWWRIAVAAVVMAAWRRPWRAEVRMTRKSLGLAAIFGLCLATMNMLFYLAIARIPMGPAVALEFTGPVLVAAIAGRRWYERAAIVLAGAGVVSIAGLGLDMGEASVGAGVLCALAAGAAWAGYILLGRYLAAPDGPKGVDILTVGLVTGALAYSPLALTTAGPAFSSGMVFAAVVAVGVLSSVVPYVIDQVNFGVISAATFAILTALLPATSLLVAAVMLEQKPGIFELLGLVLISCATALASRSPTAS